MTSGVLLSTLLALLGLVGSPPTAASAEAPLEVGVNAGPDSNYVAVRRLGARVVRTEFDIRTPVAAMRPTIRRLAASGARPVLLAGFAGRVPTRGEAQRLGEWAREFGPGGRFWAGRRRVEPVREIEFGNETSYGYQYGDGHRDASYARRAAGVARAARTAALALRGTGVGLLIQGDDGGSRSAVWMRSTLRAAPDLPSLAAGWTIHPYGPDPTARIRRMLTQAREAGARPLPVHVTEWGLATDGGRCLSDNYGWDRCLRFGTAAELLTRSVDEMRGAFGAELRMVLLYQDSDQAPSGRSGDREAYFGLTRNGGRTDKGPYTDAAVALIARR